MATNPLSELRRALSTGERADVLKAFRNEPSSKADTIGAAHLVMLEHLTRHVFADTSSFSGIRVADAANGIYGAFFDRPDNRPKHLAGAMGICHGQPPFLRGNRRQQIAGAMDDLDRTLREAAQANDWELCEDCLLAISRSQGIEAVLYRLWSLTTEPFLLGHHRTEFVGNLADLKILFDDDELNDLTTLTCNLGARLVARHPADFSGRQHEPPHRGFVAEEKLVAYLEEQFVRISTKRFAQDEAKDDSFDRAAFLEVLLNNDPLEMFQAISSALDDGVSVRSLYEQLTVNSLRRIIRGPTEAATGANSRWPWARIKRGLLVSADVRKCLQTFPPRLAARVLYHAAFQATLLSDDSFGELPDLAPSEANNPEAIRSDAANADLTTLHKSIEAAMREANLPATTRLTLQYLDQDFPGETLLRFLRHVTGDNSCGQRTLVDTWYEFRGNPDQRLVLIAMARWGAFSYR